jgi:hypothetical protein
MGLRIQAGLHEAQKNSCKNRLRYRKRRAILKALKQATGAKHANHQPPRNANPVPQHLQTWRCCAGRVQKVRPHIPSRRARQRNDDQSRASACMGGGLMAGAYTTKRTAAYDAVYDGDGALVAFVATREDSAAVAAHICKALNSYGTEDNKRASFGNEESARRPGLEATRNVRSP